MRDVGVSSSVGAAMAKVEKRRKVKVLRCMVAVYLYGGANVNQVGAFLG